MPDVAEYSAYTFDRALRGPFNSLFPIRLSASRTLCAVMRCFYLHFNGFNFYDRHHTPTEPFCQAQAKVVFLRIVTFVSVLFNMLPSVRLCN